MINNNYGWVCPKCGMANNPNVAFCSCSAKLHCYSLNVKMDGIEDIQKLKNIVFGGIADE